MRWQYPQQLQLIQSRPNWLLPIFEVNVLFELSQYLEVQDFKIDTFSQLLYIYQKLELIIKYNYMSKITVSSKLLQKLKTEMRIIYITAQKPKQKIKLDPIEPQNLNIDLKVVMTWSENNKELYQLILQNGLAGYICNQEFLFEFYKSINLSLNSIVEIDSNTLKLSNLETLNLSQNKIQTLKNIPPRCKALYLDFNNIEKINMKSYTNLQLLSISHNRIDDKLLMQIVRHNPELRCLNVSYNKIHDLRNFVVCMHKLTKLKILISFQNPISMLRIYWTYITQKVELKFFDNEQYVKPQPEQKKQLPKPQPVQQKKQDKKDTKKDNKKAPKVEEKIEVPPPVEQPKVEQPVVLTEEDFTKVTIKLVISNYQFQGTNPIVLDQSQVPENTDIKKSQTSYWIKSKLCGIQQQNYDNRLHYESATIENDQARINFQVVRQLQISQDSEGKEKFNEGIVIQLWKQQPKIIVDPENGQIKPVITGQSLQSVKQIIGSVFIDLRKFHRLKNKTTKLKYRLFSNDAVSSPLFKNPYTNQAKLIKDKMIEFQQSIRKAQEQRQKKLQQQEASKAQKKGGKDTKKAADKKATKKDAKQPVVNDKKKVDKCPFNMDQRQYCYIQDNKMFKGSNNTLAIQTIIK